MKTTKTHEVLTGICSVCLGRFVVEGRGPVLHGYKRPGDGAIRGNCDGMRFPMYETSTEGCIWVRNGLLSTAQSHRTVAGQLRSGQTKTIYCEKQVYDKTTRHYVSETVAVTADSDIETFCSVNAYNWFALVQREERRHVREAESLERQAATYQRMIEAWKPGLEFISEDRLNAEKQEARQAKQDLAARKRNFKALKAIFFHLGAAISKHKKGWLHAEWEWEQMYIKHNSKTSERYTNVHRLAPFAEVYPQLAKKAKKK